MVSQKAMDAAIQDAIRSSDQRHRAINAALEEVRPKVGRLALDGAIESERDVYGRALDILGVPRSGISELAALRQLYRMAPTPGADRPSPNSGFAHDAAPKPGSMETFTRMFGEQAARIERI